MTLSCSLGGRLKPGCVFSTHSVFLGMACLSQVALRPLSESASGYLSGW